MRHLVRYCLCACLFGQQSSYAQLGENLIPNWSYEELRFPDSEFPCPSSGGSISLTNDWSSANGSVDYFNACSNEDWPNYGVPQNILGFQEGYDGDAYANLAVYSIFFNNAREYLWMEMPNSLIHGQGYLFKCRVSLNDSANFAVANIGALFTVNTTRFLPIDSFIVAKPQVESPDSVLLEDKAGWIEIAGQFIATGGEKFITIGVFKSEDELYVQQVSSIPDIIYNWDLSSYYIDGVELREDNSIGISEAGKSTLELYPNPANDQVQINVTGSNSEMEFVTIKDQLGKVVANQRVSGLKSTIHVEHLYSGVYVVSVKLRDGSVVRSRLLKN
jgi:hypothetical protein